MNHLKDLKASVKVKTKVVKLYLKKKKISWYTKKDIKYNIKYVNGEKGNRKRAFDIHTNLRDHQLNIDYYPYRVLCTEGMVITSQKHITQKKIEKTPGITLKKVIKYKDKWTREDGNREELQRPTEN